jgi:CheY-like chemotaxis protein
VHKPKVLVAEDDPSVRMTLEFVLQDEGFSVVVAEDGIEALRLAEEESPDVILLDLVMPKMDGKTVYNALQSDTATKAIPVLVMTGMGRGPKEELPGAYFVGKPFSPDDLVRVIRDVLSKPS